MRWSELFAFMCARDPRFAATLVSVPRDIVATCERGLGIELPAFYVDFLTTMGAGSGRYRPFGAHDHDFYRLIKRIVHADYPTDRYFRVGSHDDPDLDVVQEPYLDLSRAADGDTPLVTIEQGAGFDPAHVLDLKQTLAEELTRNAFYTLEIEPRGATVMISAGAESTPAIMAVRDTAIECLEIMGMAILLAPSPRLVCLGAPELVARVEVHGHLTTTLAVELAGADPLAVRDAAEQLAAALPDAAVQRPGMRVSND